MDDLIGTCETSDAQILLSDNFIFTCMIIVTLAAMIIIMKAVFSAFPRRWFTRK